MPLFAVNKEGVNTGNSQQVNYASAEQHPLLNFQTSLSKNLESGGYLNNTANVNNEEFQFIRFRDLPLSERMRIKKQRAKMLLEKKTQRNNNNQLTNMKENLECEEDNLDDNELLSENSSLQKKTIKMIRNRISAQKSRDKRKKEMELLKEKCGKLEHENNILKNQLGAYIDENQRLKENQCEKCKKKTENRQRAHIVDSRSAINSALSNNKLGLITSLLVIVCLIGTFVYTSINDVKDKINGRILIMTNNSESTDIKTNHTTSQLIRPSTELMLPIKQSNINHQRFDIEDLAYLSEKEFLG